MNILFKEYQKMLTNWIIRFFIIRVTVQGMKVMQIVITIIKVFNKDHYQQVYLWSLYTITIWIKYFMNTYFSLIKINFFACLRAAVHFSY